MPSQAQILGAGILLVDDRESNIQLLEQMLRGAGYTAIHATRDPCAVRDLHAARHFDLIMLDLQMPVMDGFQVMQALREVETVADVAVAIESRLEREGRLAR